MIINGLIKNIKTKYGIQCYRIIKDIQVTGLIMSNNPEYKAIINFFNPETNQPEIPEYISECLVPVQQTIILKLNLVRIWNM